MELFYCSSTMQKVCRRLNYQLDRLHNAHAQFDVATYMKSFKYRRKKKNNTQTKSTCIGFALLKNHFDHDKKSCSFNRHFEWRKWTSSLLFSPSLSLSFSVCTHNFHFIFLTIAILQTQNKKNIYREAKQWIKIV